MKQQQGSCVWEEEVIRTEAKVWATCSQHYWSWTKVRETRVLKVWGSSQRTSLSIHGEESPRKTLSGVRRWIVAFPEWSNTLLSCCSNSSYHRDSSSLTLERSFTLGVTKERGHSWKTNLHRTHGSHLGVHGTPRASQATSSWVWRLGGPHEQQGRWLRKTTRSSSAAADDSDDWAMSCRCRSTPPQHAPPPGRHLGTFLLSSCKQLFVVHK